LILGGELNSESNRIEIFSMNRAALLHSCFVVPLCIGQRLSSGCRHNYHVLVPNDNYQQHRDDWWSKDNHREVA